MLVLSKTAFSLKYISNLFRQLSYMVDHTQHQLQHTQTCSVVSLIVPQPDPNTPKPEGRQIMPVKGEPLGVVSNWPPALQAALARWGATQGKSPALTALDITGKPLYTLTYGESQDGTVRSLEKCFLCQISSLQSLFCYA